MRKRAFHSPASRGFTLIELLVVIGTMVVLSTIGIAGLNYQRQRAVGLACGNNLRLIQEAKRAALEEDPTLTSFDTPTLSKYLPGGTMLVCPGNGTYSNTDSLGGIAACSLDGGTGGAHNVRLPGGTNGGK